MDAEVNNLPKSMPFPHGQSREHRCDTLKEHSRLDHIENLTVGKSFIAAINNDDNHNLKARIEVTSYVVLGH